MDERAALSSLGTVAAVAGAIIILFNFSRPYNVIGLVIGGLLVLGGLLLRIEAAIWASGSGGATTPDDAGNR